MVGENISHYKIFEILGSGGMGIVYKAEDIKLHRTVALKFLPLELTSDETAKNRFIHEAQSASSLQHNNICTIHEIDETEDGKFFIAMDYYEGETLKNKISSELLSIDEIIKITTQIADGLYKAHEKGIIHRDIKPANVFITKEGVVKILDFGLAKKIDLTQFTRRDLKFGTTNYMSPEQIKGEKVDHRTDIWSLGTILYEMLTRQHPFKADYEQAIVYLVLNQDPEDVRNYRTDVPERLLSVLEKSIAKERESRYEDLTSLLGELRKVTSKSETGSFEFELPAQRPSQSIAVLPFVNMSADPEQDYFCDGLTEELINALSKISDLRVVARTSAFAFKGGSYDTRTIGKKLNVRTVLEGSVRKSGDRLRITAQLINVMDGYHLWSERYDRELKDVFDVQDEISLTIVDVLKVKLKESEKEKLLKRYTDNIEAYNLCQQGNYFLNQLNMSMVDRAIEYFNQALAKDPKYTLAYHGLAACYFLIGYFGIKRSREIMPNMKNNCQKMLELDENYSGCYDILGLYKGCFEWKLDELDRIYKRCLEINPNDHFALSDYGLFSIIVGRFDFAKKLLERSLNIDPLYDFTFLCLKLPDYCETKYERVVENLSKYLGMNPPFWFGLWFLWRAFSLMGKKSEAVEACKKSFLVIGMNDIGNEMEKAGTDNAFLTAATIMAGIYKKHFSSPKNIALLYIHAGKYDEALKWLEEAIEVIDPQMLLINVEPDWEPVRNDPRFQACLKKIGFVK